MKIMQILAGENSPQLQMKLKKANMKITRFSMILIATLISQPLFAQSNIQRQDSVSTSPGAAQRTQTIKATATVVGIDSATRKITLKRPNGETFAIMADDEVRNFDQIKLGDVVNAEFTQALSLELIKGKAGIRERAEQDTTFSRAPEGAKPAGSIGNEVMVVADVISVSNKDKRVTLRGPGGDIVKLKVQDPDQLKNIKKGDQVKALYSESLAVAVSPVNSSAGK